ncbi:MAG: NTP transferase domain-containing protein [Oscillospiraceae bacterium]|nr:NTP transferase domain-containing protein [Oscillospiraceae bacterium]
MQAIIFNSGVGSRMGALTEKRPKGLLEVGGESLFYRQLRILSGFGIRKFIVTTGKYEQDFKAEAEKIPDISVKFVNNPLYRTTNYIYSFHLAKQFIRGDLLLLHGDLYFSEEAAKRLIESPHPDCCLINKKIPLPEKDFKARLTGDVIKEISVALTGNVPQGQTAAALQPFYKLSANLAEAWLDKAGEFINSGKVNVYAENALNEILHSALLYGISYENEFVTEIDTPEDHAKTQEFALRKN